MFSSVVVFAFAFINGSRSLREVDVLDGGLTLCVNIMLGSGLYSTVIVSSVI